MSELDAQPLVGKQILDGVAPFHEEHALAVRELVQPQVDDVLDPVQAVDVDVRDVEDAPSTPSPA